MTPNLTPLVADVLAAIGDGNRTFRIARKIGRTTAQTRRILLRMERECRVRRSERHSAVNDIFWEPVPVISSAALIAMLDDPRIAGAVNEKGGGRS